MVEGVDQPDGKPIEVIAIRKKKNKNKKENNKNKNKKNGQNSNRGKMGTVVPGVMTARMTQ